MSAGQNLALSVIVPAHNSGVLIEGTIDELSERLDGSAAEILVVENGSTDDTLARSRHQEDRRRQASVGLTVLQSDKGMGRALRAGVLASRGRRVLLTADDLPFGFDDLDHLDRLESSIDGPVPPILIGSKAHLDSTVERGALRGTLTWGFSVLVRAILGMRTRDPQGTLILEGNLARELAQLAVEPGYLFTTELIYLAERVGIRPVELPVRLRESHRQHRSRIHAADMVAMAIGLMRIRARHFGSRRLGPLKAHLPSPR
jgi:glycosyltransferase involved in cell wall biosynthesis